MRLERHTSWCHHGQNTIQTRLLSASYVVLEGSRATLWNSHLKLHTLGKKERASFMRQNFFRIDMVTECRKRVKTMLKWKLNGMQYWRLDLSLEPLRRTTAAGQTCSSGVQPRVCPSKLRGREVILSLRQLWGQGPWTRVSHPSKRASHPAHREVADYQMPGTSQISVSQDSLQLEKFIESLQFLDIEWLQEPLKIYFFHLLILQLEI